ncbi:MAG: 1-phosphofructokinase family hexose kinase [Eubacteriales bacterium]
MILTICPNPSMDCTIELDNLNVGMLNRISNKVETYSGKALNVAMGVARLKEKSFATGFMFENNGKMFEQTLEREGVAHKFVWNKGSVRVNYKIIDKRSMLTEINDKGDEVSEEKQRELIDLVKVLAKDCDIAVMSGSLPKGVNAEFYGEVLKNVPASVKKVVDTEKANLEFAVKENLYMVKPNLRELENIAGDTLSTKYDILKASYALLNKGVKMVMVSLGSEGAILTDGIKSFYCKSANVAVNSTVGAGDSMLASACVQIEKGADMEELLRCSVAAGTAAITTSGTNLFYKDKYEEIYNKIYVEPI